MIVLMFKSTIISMSFSMTLIYSVKNPEVEQLGRVIHTETAAQITSDILIFGVALT